MGNYREDSKYRNEDERLMKLISDFLDVNLYSSDFNNIKRHEDKETQVKGIDIEFNLNNTDYKYVCDEKSAVRYINNPLGTFALELSFINKSNVVQDGWFISDNNDTNSYMLIWVNKADSNKPNTIEEIREVEVALVKKEKIMEYLQTHGWNKNLLKKKCNLIRTNPNENQGNLYKNGCKFSFSKQLVEQPINILLAKQTYIEISDYYKKINK